MLSLLPVYLTTKPVAAQPQPILHKGGRPTRIQQHGSHTPSTSTAQCTAGRQSPTPARHTSSLLLQASCNSHTRPGLTDMGRVERLGKQQRQLISKLLCSSFPRRVRIPDPLPTHPRACKERAQEEAKKSLGNLPTQQSSLSLNTNLYSQATGGPSHSEVRVLPSGVNTCFCHFSWPAFTNAANNPATLPPCAWTWQPKRTTGWGS